MKKAYKDNPKAWEPFFSSMRKHFISQKHLNGKCNCNVKNNPSNAAIDFYEKYLKPNYKEIQLEISIYGKSIDFYLFNEDLAIEYCSLYWHGTQDINQIKKDKTKQKTLLKRNLPVVYFWENEFNGYSFKGSKPTKTVTQKVVERIQKAIDTRECQGYFTF